MPERLPPKPATSAGQFDLFGKRVDGPRVYSVSELTRGIKGVLEGRFPSVLVKGEVSKPESARQRARLLHAEGRERLPRRGPLPHRGAPASSSNPERPLAGGRAGAASPFYEPKGGYQLVSADSGQSA